jgi:hypothetical protein
MDPAVGHVVFGSLPLSSCDRRAARSVPRRAMTSSPTGDRRDHPR